MKKIILASLSMLMLASCGIGKSTPTDYASLYNANMKAELQESKEFFQSVVGKAEEFSGNLSSLLELKKSEDFTSVAISSDVSGVAEPRGNSEITLSQPKLTLKGQKNGVAMVAEATADSFSLINSLGGTYAKYAGLQLKSEGGDVDQDSIIKALKKAEQFAGRWIQFPTTESQLAQEKIILKLFSLTVADFEKYLTTHHVFTAISEGKMDGSKVTFDVKFSPENTLALISAVVKDIAEHELTEDDKAEFLEAMKNISVSGTITFDTKDALYSAIDVVVKNSAQFENLTTGTSEEFKIVASRVNKELKYEITALENNWEKENGAIVVKNSTTKGKLTFNSTSSGKNSDFSMKLEVSETEGELLKISGKIEDAILKTLDGTLSAGIVNGQLTFKHGESFKMNASMMGEKIFELSHVIDKNNHTGTLSLQGKQFASWLMQTENDVLTNLSLIVENFIQYSPYATEDTVATKPLFALNLVKKENDDFIRGKMEITPTSLETISADVGLQADAKTGKFGLILENIVFPEGITEEMKPSRFEFFMASKAKETAKTVIVPTEFVTFEEFSKAIDE